MKKTTSLLRNFIIKRAIIRTRFSIRWNQSNPTYRIGHRISDWKLHFTSGPRDLVNQNFTMSGNNITTNHYHCPGMLTVICPGIDTLPIGVLSAGTYNVTANLFQGTFDSIGNCAEFIKIDSTDFVFIVSVGTGVDQILKANPTVFLNKETISISNLYSTYEFVLYDVRGKQIISRNVSSTENNFSISVEPGVYFYSLRKEGKQEFTGKLVVGK
ncbi:MAG: T9SS type A sorting domain-containing protein [Bacteroidetes bacterium]|nr:T9SS type A sorting domain-containing protein [Bacteroidota bacterium]